MNFKPEDAFVGYQEDTPAAIILQASREAVEMPDIIDKLSKVNNSIKDNKGRSKLADQMKSCAIVMWTMQLL